MAWVPPGGQESACDSHRLRNVHLDGHKCLHNHPRTVPVHCQCLSSCSHCSWERDTGPSVFSSYSMVSSFKEETTEGHLYLLCLLRFVRGCLERCNQGTLLLPLLHGSLAFMRHLCRDALCSTVIFSGNSAG